MIICLIGFMGCGKSSVGRRLSELLCCPFMDLDDVIETREGRSIPEIFATDGEAVFRQMELSSLQRIVLSEVVINDGKLHLTEHDATAVLALGGGTVMTKECAELVKENTCCIYLRASVETLLSHLEGESAGRPMLHTVPHAVISSETEGRDEKSSLQSRIEDLMAARSATYENTAHIIIDTDGQSVGSVAEMILKY